MRTVDIGDRLGIVEEENNEYGGECEDNKVPFTTEVASE